MSLGIKPEKTYLALDPRIDTDSPIDGYYVEKGGAKVSYEVVDASTTNSQSIQFSTNINPPSPQTFFSRKIPMRFPFTIVLTPNEVLPVGQNVFQQGLSGLRAYGMHKSINSMSMRLNTQTVTQSVGQYIDALTRFNVGKDLEELNYSGSAVYHDKWQQYQYPFRYGTFKNPLADWGEGVNPRGFGHPCIRILENSNVQAVLYVDLYEYLMISPCKWDRKEHMGFYGIQTMNLTINLKSNLEKWLWSHNNVNGLANLTASVTMGNDQATYAQLLFTYITPDLAQFEEIPRALTYDYQDVQRYLKQTAHVNANESGTLRSENIQLGSVPKRVYIYVDRIESDRTIYTTDSYARIDRLEVNFDNQTSQIASADSFQLWKMAVKNGSRQSWADWNKFAGSIACIDFGAGDLGMNSLTATGLLGNFNLRIECNFTNIDYDATPPIIQEDKNYQLNVVVVQEGSFVVYRDQLQAFAQLGLVSKKDIIDSPENEKVEVVQDLEGSGAFLTGAVGALRTVKSALDKYCALKKQYGFGIKGVGAGDGRMMGGALANRQRLSERFQ